jgi:hypothetical protein
LLRSSLKKNPSMSRHLLPRRLQLVLGLAEREF